MGRLPRTSLVQRSQDQREQGAPVVTEPEWNERATHVLKESPDVAAVEAWYADGVTVALAKLRHDGRVGVTVREFKDVPTAGAFAQSSGARLLLAGKSIAGDASVIGSTPKGGTTRQAVLDVRRLIDDDALVHDGSEELANQLLAVRVRPGPDGPRVVSRSRMDAVKCAVWAAEGARTAAELPAIF